MFLLDKLDQLRSEDPQDHSERVLTHKLTPELAKLAGFSTTKEMEKSSVYQILESQLRSLTYGYEYGCYADQLKSTKPFYRAICWNLENGKKF